MNLSILIIGKNTEKTLEKCISSIFDAIQNTKYIDSCDIIYIDSNSSDSSVDIAKAKKVETIEMIDGFTTASLGRYLGLKHSNHNNKKKKIVRNNQNSNSEPQNTKPRHAKKKRPQSRRHNSNNVHVA